MADKRITDVDYIESLDGSETFFVNQNGAIKQASRGNAFKNAVWSVENGGTGATTAASARTNLGITPANIGAQTKHEVVTTTLSVGGWSNRHQSISISNLSTNNTVIVSASPSSYTTYAEYGIYCFSQEIDKLTFTCDSVPDSDVDVRIIILR
jgi:hypothetical protein